MKNMKKTCAAMAVVLSVAVAAPMLTGGIAADAAKKPKLSSSKLSIKVGESKTLKVKNFKKKVTWKTSKKSVAKLSKIKKTSVKVTGKKKGSAKVTATMKFGKKKLTLTCKVTVKNNTPAPTPVAEEPTLAPATPIPTSTPIPTATPEPTFDYDGYAGCLWKGGEIGDAKIKDLFSDYFISGISTDLGGLRNGEKSSFVRYHYGSVTMGNEHKMESIVSNDATDAYPNGFEKANVDAYYATGGEAKIILNYDNIEKTLSFCKANGLKLRYHALLWHSQVREYFFLQDYNWSEYTEEDYIANNWDVNNYHKLADKETMKKRINDYISQVIEYIYSHGYGDVVYAYDVINEATNGDGGNTHRYYINESATSVDGLLSTTSTAGASSFQTNGGVRTNGNKGGGHLVTVDSSPEEVEQMMRAEGRTPANDSYWYTTMGPDYLYLAFMYAHDAIEKYYEQYKAQFGYTSKPSLIYNDYNPRETDHIALAKYINLACNLEKGTQGVTYCDGIGLQSHSIPEDTQERMIKAIVDAGLECQITELDEGATGEAQAKKIKKLYQIYMKYSKNGEYGKAQGSDYIGVTSVTQWGICDGDGSWSGDRIHYVTEPYEGDDPNLQLNPKPAFFAVLQAGGVECGEKIY